MFINVQSDRNYGKPQGPLTHPLVASCYYNTECSIRVVYTLDKIILPVYRLRSLPLRDPGVRARLVYIIIYL